jgi:hypothetical protein
MPLRHIISFAENSEINIEPETSLRVRSSTLEKNRRDLSIEVALNPLNRGISFNFLDKTLTE